MEKSFDDLKVKALEFKNHVFGLQDTSVSVGAGKHNDEWTIFVYVHTNVIALPEIKEYKGYPVVYKNIGRLKGAT